MREWRKSADPKVPVTRGGAVPLGVRTVTVVRISDQIYQAAANSLTIVANMAKYLFMAHLPESELAPITVGQEIFHSMQPCS